MALVPTNMFGRRVTTQPTQDELNRASRFKAIQNSKKITVLESLRGTHPELFLLSLSPEDSNVRCVRNKYNLDVTKDDVLEVLLRPHVDLICNGKAGKLRANSVWIFINDVIDKLGLELDDIYPKWGIHPNINTEYTDDTNTAAAISYLRSIIYMMAKDIQNAENKAKLLTNRETKRRANQAIREAERRAKNQANWKAKHERNILGLSSASAAAEPEVNLLNMNAIRKAEIAKNLEGLFGGVRRTGKHKYRKSSKSRKSHKSRKHSRK